MTEFAISNDGLSAASGSLDGTIRIWNLQTKRWMRVWDTNTLNEVDAIRVDGVPRCLTVGTGTVYVGCDNASICVYQFNSAELDKRN